MNDLSISSKQSNKNTSETCSKIKYQFNNKISIKTKNTRKYYVFNIKKGIKINIQLLNTLAI